MFFLAVRKNHWTNNDDDDDDDDVDGGEEFSIINMVSELYYKNRNRLLKN